MAAPFAFDTTTAPGAPFVPEESADPCALVIFGGAGDLAKRKLIPALYNLTREGELPEGVRVIGMGRTPMTDDEYRSLHREATAKFSRHKPIDEALWNRFAQRLSYRAGDLANDHTYRGLRDYLRSLDEAATEGNRLYFFSVPPSSFPVILGGAHRAGLILQPGGRPWSRMMIEKPFGNDLQSAQELNRMATEFLAEDQIFRIDHYLGKETVQNILVMRFANAIFEPLWNRKYIDYIEITAAEDIGVEGRGKFYDETGALRDVVQNHLIEVLALVAMEAPVSLRGNDIRDAKAQVLRSLRPVVGEEVGREVVRGQYRGYTAEADVAPGSQTPTFAALKVMIDNWRWQGVPFYVRAGKKLKKRLTEVAIHFQPVPLCLFGRDEVCQRLDPNVLTLRIQPDEGITLQFMCKEVGGDVYVSRVTMDFSYARAFSRQAPEAYERLFLDCMRGDPTNFARRDSVEEAWEYCTPILEAWENGSNIPLHTYESGTAGPEAADALLRRDGRRWRDLT